MSKNYTKEMAKIKGYVRENWGAPFIVGFMLLLMATAASLSIGFADLANVPAICAYYALMIGVILQLVCFLKYNKRHSEQNYESN